MSLIPELTGEETGGGRGGAQTAAAFTTRLKDSKMDQRQCEFKDCTRTRGHDGPHGIDAGRGLIPAPWGGGDGELSDPMESKIECDACRGPMTMSSFSEGGGLLACAKCGQEHTYHADGKHYQKSITLFPSKMEEGSQIFRQYIAYTEKACKFDMIAMLTLGLLSRQQYEDKIKEIDSVIGKWHADNPLPSPKIGFWKRIRSFVGT